jgi:hypothetical protein
LSTKFEDNFQVLTLTLWLSPRLSLSSSHRFFVVLNTQAFISKSTRGFRALLHQHGIKFAMPHTKRKPDDDLCVFCSFHSLSLPLSPVSLVVFPSFSSFLCACVLVNRKKL